MTNESVRVAFIVAAAFQASLQVVGYLVGLVTVFAFPDVLRQSRVARCGRCLAPS
jgi:zinc transporter ZupT